MDLSPAPENQYQPVHFSDLTPRAQKAKVRCKARIELNWKCTVQDAVPAQIRPRLGPNQRQKMSVDYADVEEAKWWQWSECFLQRLARFSDAMRDGLATAMELMLAEVRRRQRDPTDIMNRAAELLARDLDRLIAAKKLEAVLAESRDRGNYSGANGEDQVMEEINDEGEGDVEECEDGAEGDIGVLSEQPSYPMSTTTVPALANATASEQPANPTSINQSSATAKTKKIQKMQVRIAELRAKAMRLKQKALKREAEAYELEAKVLRSDMRRSG